MNASELRNKSMDELAQELVELKKEQFSLRMQHGSGEASHTNLMSQGRKNIARVKTVMNEKKKAGES